MGRHSAPDDGDLLVEPAAPADAAAPSRPRPRPRHAVADDNESDAAALVDTDVIEPEVVERALQPPPANVIDAEVVEDEPVAPAPFAAPPELPAPPATSVTRERPTRTDLRMLRQDAALRARAIAAVLVPFVVYTVVLAVIGKIGVYLYWIWIPAILAGVLFGAQLDAAARKVADQGMTSPERPAP